MSHLDTSSINAEELFRIVEEAERFGNANFDVLKNTAVTPLAVSTMRSKVRRSQEPSNNALSFQDKLQMSYGI